MPELHIRLATEQDAEVVALFNRHLAAETEHITLDPATVLAGVRAILSDASRGRYLVAEVDGVVVGQLAHTREWSDWRNGDLWWVQSVYILESHRGKGVFKALFRRLEAMALEAGDVVGIRLYVENENREAQSAYRRLGLAKTHYHVMEKVWSRPGGH